MPFVNGTLLTSVEEHQTITTHNPNRHCRVHFYACVGQLLSKQLYTPPNRNRTQATAPSLLPWMQRPMITNGTYQNIKFSYCLAVVESFHRVPKLSLFCRPLHLQRASSGMEISLGLHPRTVPQSPPRKLHARVHGYRCQETLCWSVHAINTNTVTLLSTTRVTSFKTNCCVTLAHEWESFLSTWSWWGWISTVTSVKWISLKKQRFER